MDEEELDESSIIYESSKKISSKKGEIPALDTQESKKWMGQSRATHR